MDHESYLLLCELLTVLPAESGERSFAYATRAQNTGLINTIEAYKIRSHVSLVHFDGEWLCQDALAAINRRMTAAQI